MNERVLEIAKRIREVHEEIHALSDHAQLVAVTKYSTVEEIVMAYQSMQLDFGENKVQDLKLKAQYFFDHGYKDVRWHFIGHLQSNKVKDLLNVPHLYAIHSIDSVKLVAELLKRQHELSGKKIKIFLQYNTSNEEEKSGFESIEDLSEALELLLSQPSSFIFSGLMTMGSIRADNLEKAALDSFQKLVDLKYFLEQKYSLPSLELSMGMSDDYKIALELGATYVRIGSKIFK